MAVSQVKITSKTGLIYHTTAEWNTFVSYVDGLIEDQWLGPKDASGWSVKDHVSHVTQWDVPVIELFRHGTPMQQTLGIPDDLWTAEDYYPVNEIIRAKTITDSIEIVKSERDAIWLALLSELEGLSEEQLATPASKIGLNVDATSLTPLLEVLVGYLGGHYAEHLGYIRIITQSSS